MSSDEENPLLDGLLKAWVEAGRGNTTRGRSAPRCGLFEDQNFGLLAQLPQGADPGTCWKFRRCPLSHSGGGRDRTVAGQPGRRSGCTPKSCCNSTASDEAKAHYRRRNRRMHGSPPSSSRIWSCCHRSRAKPFPSAYITDPPSDGAAEVLLTLATALGQQEAERFALVYARLAQAVRPDYVDALPLHGGRLRGPGANTSSPLRTSRRYTVHVEPPSGPPKLGGPARFPATSRTKRPSRS